MLDTALTVITITSLLLNIVFVVKFGLNARLSRIKTVIIPIDRSTERIELFFRTISPLLQELYPIVDRYLPQRGRKPLDHHFQLRFLIYHWVFGNDSLYASLKRLNRSPDLQRLLDIPVNRYHPTTLHLFLTRIGKSGLLLLIFTCVKYGVKHGLFRLQRLLIDSFPVYSPLSPKKWIQQLRCTSAAYWHILETLDWHWLHLLPQPTKGRKRPWNAIIPILWWAHVSQHPSLSALHQQLRNLPEWAL